MSWPILQPSLADETSWRALVRSAMPSSGELGYEEGRDISWIASRVTAHEFSLSWLLRRMVEDGELTVTVNLGHQWYRKTGVVGTPSLELPGADTASPGDVIQVNAMGDGLEVVPPVLGGGYLTHPQVLARGLGA